MKKRYSWLGRPALALGALALVCVAATPALADDADAKLSVRVDNGVDELAAEGSVVYTLVVRNDSGADLPTAVVSQLLPAALSHESARPKASDAEANQVQWVVEIPAGEAVTLTMNGRVGALGKVRSVDGNSRLTSTVCVAPDADGALASCTSESDPVGPPAPPDSGTERVVVPAALGVVVAGGGGYLWYRRKNGVRSADDE